MAIKDIYHNYFYGKANKRDFTEADLPSDRIKLFMEVLKVRKGSMIGLNLLYILIWIPVAIWTAVNCIQLFTIQTAMYESLLLTYLLVLFPLTAITGPFTAGIAYVMRNWARDEHSFPYSDFKTGMKNNWKQALPMSLISGMVPLNLYLCIRFYSGMTNSSVLFYIPSAILVFAAMIWMLSVQLMPTMMVTYDLRFSALVKNCVLLTLANLLKSMGIRFGTLLLPFLLLLGMLLFPSAMGWLGAILIIAYAMFIPCFNKLVQASFSNYICEKYLNPKIEGAAVDIGLRPK